MQQSAELVIVHLLSSSRNAGSNGGLSSQELRTGVAHAASQLGVLSSAQTGNASELAAELYAKARGMLNSKQAATRRQGLDLASSAIACCNRRAFLASQLDWFAAVAGLLRAEQDAAVAAAGWACLATLFSRLQRMLDVPGVRRDGATMIPKLVALLQQRYPAQATAGGAAEGPRALAAEPAVLRALLAAATALPAPFRQHLKYLEPLLTGTLAQPGLTAGAVRLAAACVAALPRVNGDGSSWSAMAQRLLASCHCLLDTLLLGLEDQGLVGTARELLDPQAQPLPGLPQPSSASLAAYKAAFGQLETVAEALQVLLTASYPSAVPLPSMGLLLLAARVLGVDDACGRGKSAGTKFGELCLRLPALHALALRLLCTLLRAARAQLAPLYLTTARLLAEYLGRVAGGGAGALTPTSPKVRAQLYEATQLLLQSGGVGVVRALSPALLACARTELYGGGPAAAAAGGSGSKGGGGGGEQQPAKKPRKSKGQGGAAGEGEESIGGAPNDDAGALTARLNLSAQAGVLGAVEALLTCGAALLTQPDRDQADAIAAHMASTTAAAAQKLSQDADGDASHLAPLQLAAYRALLAAVLAPVDHRPAHLPLALALFRGGLRGGAAELGGWCSQALLCCEALLHPRATPHPAPLRPLAPTLGAAAGGAFGFGGGASAGAVGLGPGLGSVGDGDGERAGLGRPLFWSYLDAVASSEAAAAGTGLAAAAAAVAAAGALASAGAGGLQLQPQERQGLGIGVDVEMEEAAAVEPAANGVLLPPMAPLGQQQQQQQLAGPATASGLAVAAAQQAQQHAQQAQRQQVSSMAAMMMGGVPSAAAPAAVPAMPAVPAVPAPAAVLPAAAPALAAGANAAAQPQPPVAAPAPLLGSSRAAGAAAAGPSAAGSGAAAGRLALAGGDDSDSDGPLPDIDSGGEESESESE